MGVENNIPEGWVETTIGNLVELAQGVAINAKTNHVLSDKGNGLPLLKINNLLNDTIDQYANPDLVPKKSIIHKNDVIFTRTGQVGEVLINKYGILHNNSFKVIPNEKLYWNYLYWYLKSNRVYNYVQKVASGSVQMDLNHSAFKTIEIKYPTNIDEQKAIAKVLTAFDDKVELLQAQNKTLTTLSQTIFKEWFIDFNFPNSEKNPYKLSGGKMIENDFGLIPEGWSMKTIEEIADFQNGYAFYTIGYASEGKKVVDLLNIDQLGIFKESPRDKKISLEIYNAEKFKKFHLHKNDLVMAMTDMTQEMGILGKCGKIKTSNKFILNQRIGRIRAKEGVNVNFLMVYLNSKYQINHLKKLSLGTVQKYVNTNHIKEMQFIIPSISIMNSFASIVDDLFKKIDNNDSQIQSLTKTRDTLLPKLMSGKVRVNNIKQTADA
jgi:type I restriction enzyme, S subunit